MAYPEGTATSAVSASTGRIHLQRFSESALEEASLDYSSPAAEHDDDAVSLAAPVTISAADVLLVASLLYGLRVRALSRAFRAAQRRQGGIEASLERRLFASEDRSATVSQTTSRDMSTALAVALADHRAESLQVSSRALAEQDVQYAELVASIRERDNDTRTVIADVRTAFDALTSAAREERTAHRRAADADARALASERALQDAHANESRALEDARNAGAQRATDAAVAREAALRAAADALRRAAEDAPALSSAYSPHKRASPHWRSAPLSHRWRSLYQKRVVRWLRRPTHQRPHVPSVTHYSAGRILFDPPIEPLRRPPTRPPAQLSWPDDALDTRPPAAPEDVGLPDD
eukprot:IDg4423t1